jgi:hypothetical protein
MQIAEVGISLRVGVNPSINNRVVSCKRGLRESRTILILIRQIIVATAHRPIVLLTYRLLHSPSASGLYTASAFDRELPCSDKPLASETSRLDY